MADGGGGAAAPGVPPTGLGRDLVALADPGGAGLGAWLLDPGMGFGDLRAWWRPGGRRPAPHEGVDLRCYRDASGRRRCLGAGSPVPAGWDGAVAAVVEDFLGRSVFLRHGTGDARRWRLHSVLGHLRPRDGLGPGTPVAAGEVVGALADPSRRRGAPPPHLHLSLALVAPGVDPAALGWDLLRDPARARLLDPAPLLGTFAP